MSGNRIEIDVLCVGIAPYDLVFSVSYHPGPDEKTRATAFRACGGGPAANAAVQIVRLGYSSALVAYLGNDRLGDRHHRELEQEGVVLTMIVRGESPTPVSAILVKPNGQRTVVHYREGDPFLSRYSVDMSVFAPKAVLSDDHELLMSVSIADWAKRRGSKVILDAESADRTTVDVLRVVDYLVCSREFAHDFTSEVDLENALVELSQIVPAVVITCSEEGLLWSNEGSLGRLPAFAVDAVDTTGAGDAFHGAFAACIASGASWEHTLRYSSAVGALVCTRVGGRLGLPTKQAVCDFLKTHEDL